VIFRSIEDQLREEYFALLPEMARLAEHLKTQIQYSILPIARKLKLHESLVVKARVKDCNSAISKLEKINPSDPLGGRNPGGVFDRDHPELYTLRSLRDMVGVRVLAFPSGRAAEVDSLLRTEFSDWEPDHVVDNGQQLAFKYNGRHAEFTENLWCEYQIVSALIGLFWEVEHAAIYKQAPGLKGLGPVMQEQTSAVNQALKDFEDEFERQIQASEASRATL
jgi:ppGpp synthetase/RelA/SpoT-type nucleotidyltranferase